METEWMQLQNHGVTLTLEHGTNLGIHISGKLVEINNGHYFQLEYDQVKEIVEFVKERLSNNMTNELIKLNEILLDHFRKGENIPDQLVLEIAWVIDGIKSGKLNQKTLK